MSSWVNKLSTAHSVALSEPKEISFAEIQVGDAHSFSYTITESVYKNFMQAFDDRSPIHIDEQFAKDQGFQGRVMHGSILNGFVSHFVGMYFPGLHSLLHSVELKFAKACYLNEEVEITCKVAQKVESLKVIILDARVKSITQDLVVARGKVQVGMRT